MTSTITDTSAEVIIEPLASVVTPESALVSFAGATEPVILENTAPDSHFVGWHGQAPACPCSDPGPRANKFAHATQPDTHSGRYSVFACEPVEVLEIDSRCGSTVFQQLEKRLRAYPRVVSPANAPGFVGGWLGFLSYEAGLGLEGIPSTGREDFPWPVARFGLYDAAAVFDHHAGTWQAVAVDWPAPVGHRRPSAVERIEMIRERLDSAPPTLPEPICTPGLKPLRPSLSPDAYFAAVERAKAYIAAGDIYQVNLTRRFSTRTGAEPIDLYRRLRRESSAPRSAYLSWTGGSILCASPELFLDLRDGQVVTRPIKGTRPRGRDGAQDETLRRELQASEKDTAELNMIIDLLRNDLGRVCRFGTVRVTDPCTIEAHPNVFHRVATITGTLAAGRSRVDLLKATFPGGSITGAPKIRAMQIIDELEPTPRTVYCGSIGYLGLDGSMSLNIAIRTMVQIDSEVHIHAGGAIVADSDPEAEYQEIMVKAKAMFEAAGCRLRPESRRKPAPKH